MKQIPILFAFGALESVSRTLDNINGKFHGLKTVSEEVNKNFKNLSFNTEAARKGLESIGEKIKSVGTNLTLGVTVPLGLLAGKMIHTSIAAEETASKFEQVFKSINDGVKNASIDRLKTSLDLSTQSAQEMVATTGLLAKDLGLSDKQALKMGEQVTSLAVRMAAFRNISGGAEQATETLRAAMLGQTKGLKQLGISITDAQILEEARKMAQRGARFETIEQAKALVILSLIQKRTTDDQEDFRESSQSLENQLRVSAELFREVSKTIGDIVKPLFASLVSVVNSLQRAFLALSPTTKKVLVIFAGIAAVMGPLITMFGFFVGTILPAFISILSAVAFRYFIATFLPTLAALLTEITITILSVIGMFLLFAAAVAGLIVLGVLIYKNWERVKFVLETLWDGPLVRFLRFITGLDLIITFAKLIMTTWEPIKSFFGGIFDSIMTSMQPVFDRFNALIELAKRFFSFLGNTAMKILFGDKDPFGAIPKPMAGQFPEKPQTPTDIISSYGRTAGELGTQAQSIGKSIAQEFRQINDSRVQIDFTNVPKGTKVQGKSSNGIAPTLNLGMAGGLL